MAVHQVHLVRREEVPPAAASLVRAFLDDPLIACMFPDPRSRASHLGRFFTRQLRRTPRGKALAYTTDGCHSTALWTPPRTGSVELSQALAQIPTFLTVARRAPDGLQLVRRAAARRPKTPHFYLGGLGTDPAWRRQGLASATLSPVLERCDREGIPAYLESSRVENLGFYRRRGFEVVEEMAVPDGSVRIWLMWREPAHALSPGT